MKFFLITALLALPSTSPFTFPIFPSPTFALRSTFEEPPIFKAKVPNVQASRFDKMKAKYKGPVRVVGT